MVEQMLSVSVVTAAEKKNAMLPDLQQLGLLHLKERKAADSETTRRLSRLYHIWETLKEYSDKKQSLQSPVAEADFAQLYRRAEEAIDRKAKLEERLTQISRELERISPWGDFSPVDVKELGQRGVQLRFYRLEKAQYRQALQDDSLRFIRLADVDKMVAVAALGTLPSASEFLLPEKGAVALRQEMDDLKRQLDDCRQQLHECAAYGASFREALIREQNAVSLSSAAATAQADGDFVWLTGYLPAVSLDSFRQEAARQGWAWAADEVAPDDNQVPTKLRYNRVTKLIRPLFDILGILPGYREQDISLWFLLFLAMFVAMILGDGGYGLLILLGAGIAAIRKRAVSNALLLVFVMGGATVLWGTVTGTWFGWEGAMEIPLLKALVIPSFASYPDYFGVSSTLQQNTIMKFSFSLGAIQMALGSILAIREKIKKKDLSWLSNLGWGIAVAAMYLLSLYLVIGAEVPLKPVFICIGCAFLLVLLFGGMEPGKSFGQGLKSGVSSAFTVFLDTISCFGNVMSYIRLFAVGMASLAIAQSFNSIAAGFHGPATVLGIPILLIGHGLNFVMGLLSVVVHGVRLNVLEFSGQVGLEWTGIAYEPFQVNKTLKK